MAWKRVDNPLPLMMDQEPRFRTVKRALLARMGRQWKVGDRLPPIQDLARELGVSPNNVQLAVRELAGEGVLLSRKRLGVYVRAAPTPRRTRPARHAQPLAGQTIDMVCGCHPIPPFVQRMLDGFQEAIGAAGPVTTRLVRASLPQELPPQQAAWGTVVFNPLSDFNVPAGYRNVVVVSAADHLHPDLMAHSDAVGVDQYQGGMLAGAILRDAGCRRVCFLGRRIASKSGRYDLTSVSRLHGFEWAWKSHLKGPDLLFAPGYSIQSGAARFRDFMNMSPRPDGVFAASDELAIGFIAAATAAGVTAGKDFQIVGFDAQHEDWVETDIRLTSIAIPAVQMGRAAAQRMLQRAANGAGTVQRIALPCSVVAGASAKVVRPNPQGTAS